MIHYSILESNTIPTTKTYKIRDDEIKKEVCGLPGKFHITHKTIDSIQELPQIFDSLSDKECLIPSGFFPDAKIDQPVFCVSQRNKNRFPKAKQRLKTELFPNDDDIVLSYFDIDESSYINEFVSFYELNTQQFLDWLRSHCPEFNNVAFLLNYSSSSFITGSNNLATSHLKAHLYFACTGAVFKKLKANLINLMLNQGYRHQIKGNKYDSLFDPAVFGSSERLAFECEPVLLNGLKQNKPAPQFFPALNDSTTGILTKFNEIPLIETLDSNSISKPTKSKGYSKKGKKKQKTANKAVKKDSCFTHDTLNFDDVLYIGKDTTITVKEVVDSPEKYKDTLFCLPKEESHNDYALDTHFNYFPNNHGICFFHSHAHGGIQFNINNVAKLQTPINLKEYGNIYPTLFDYQYNEGKQKWYIPDNLSDLIQNSICAVIKADKGTGKNHNLIANLLDMALKLRIKCTLIMPQILLTQFAQSNLFKQPKFKNLYVHYQEINDLNENAAIDVLVDKLILITTPNSMTNHNVQKHIEVSDFVIFDECSKVMKTFFSSIIQKNQRKPLFDYWTDLIKNKRTFHLSADIDKIYLFALNQIASKVDYFHANQSSRDKLNAGKEINWIGNAEELKENFKLSIKNGRKSLFVCDNKKECNLMCSILKELYPDKKGEIVTGDNSHKLSDFIENLNVKVLELDWLIYNTALSVGVSIDVKYFEVLYGLYCNVVNYNDFEQCLERNRPDIEMFLSCKHSDYATKDATSIYDDKLKEMKDKRDLALGMVFDENMDWVIPKLEAQKMEVDLFDKVCLKDFATDKTSKTKDKLIASLESTGYKINYLKSERTTEERKELKASDKAAKLAFTNAQLNAIANSANTSDSLTTIGKLANKAIGDNKHKGIDLTDCDQAHIIQSEFGVRYLTSDIVKYHENKGLWDIQHMELLLMSKSMVMDFQVREFDSVPMSIRNNPLPFYKIGRDILKYANIQILNDMFVFDDDFEIKPMNKSANFTRYYESNKTKIKLFFTGRQSKKPHIVLKSLIEYIGFRCESETVKINGKREYIYRFTKASNHFFIDALLHRKARFSMLEYE